MVESATLEIALQHVALRGWCVNKAMMYLLHQIVVFIFHAEYRCHVFVRSDSLACVVIADHDYPPRVCFTLMNKVGLVGEGGKEGGEEGRREEGKGEREREGKKKRGSEGEGGGNLWLISGLSGELALSFQTVIGLRKMSFMLWFTDWLYLSRHRY